MTANTILQAREAPADEGLRQGGAGSAPAEAVLPLLEAVEAMLGKLTPDVVLALLPAARAWYEASPLRVAAACPGSIGVRFVGSHGTRAPPQ